MIDGAKLLGRQEPRLRSCPAYRDTHGARCVQLAALAGLNLDPWQRLVLDDGLAYDRDARNWISRTVALVVPRQNGKGSILEALELYALFGLKLRYIIHTAHELKTARGHFTRMKNLIEGAPDLAAKVRQYRNSTDEISIELQTGQKLHFIARSTGSGRGFTADLLILDEAMILGPEALAALLFTVSAKPHAQVWWAGSAGLETSEALTKLRNRALAGGRSRFCYLEWSVPSADETPDGVDPDPDDEGTWAAANPGYGRRIMADAILDERDTLPEVQFLRERLGVWFVAGGSVVLPEPWWNACADPTSQLTEPAWLAIDVQPDRALASISGASRRPDGLVHVETLDNRQGTGWIVDRIAGITERRAVRGVVVDMRSAAASLVPALQVAKVDVIEVNTAEYGQACGQMYDGVRDATIRHRGQLVLAAAVDAGRKRTMGDAWAWHRRDAGSDITPLVSATLALHAALAAPDAKPSKVSTTFYSYA